MQQHPFGRRAPRRTLPAHCSVVPHEFAPAVDTRLRIIDLSELGARLRTSSRLTTGQRLGLRFGARMPLEHADLGVTVLAEVMWIEPSDDGFIAGVEFLDMDTPTRALLAAAVPRGPERTTCVSVRYADVS